MDLLSMKLNSLRINKKKIKSPTQMIGFMTFVQKRTVRTCTYRNIQSIRKRIDLNLTSFFPL